MGSGAAFCDEVDLDGKLAHMQKHLFSPAYTPVAVAVDLVTVQSKDRRIFQAFFEGQRSGKQANRIRKARKATKTLDFRVKQGFFGLNSYYT